VNGTQRTWRLSALQRKVALLGAVMLVGSLQVASGTGRVWAEAGSSTPPGRVNAARISTADRFRCVVTDAARVVCWGGAPAGGSTDGTSSEPGLPMVLPPPGTAVGVAVSDGHACALLTDGNVTCWGNGRSGQLGVPANLSSPVYYEPSPMAPIQISDASRAVSVDLGAEHSCALLSDGGIACWGSGHVTGSNSSSVANHVPYRIPLPPPGTASAVSAGGAQTCALLTDGKVTCWGDDTYGQLGDGPALSTNPSRPSAPITLPSPGTATAISVGERHACAVLSDGRITCWGSDELGQLGNGPGGDQSAPSAPVALPAPSTAKSVSAGTHNTCAILTDGGVSCWGSNLEQPQSIGGAPPNFVRSEVPAPRLRLPPVAALATGGQSTCVIASGAHAGVWCWGIVWRSAGDDVFQFSLGWAAAPFVFPGGQVVLPASMLRTLSPMRFLETRAGPGLVTIDGASRGEGRRPSGSTYELRIVGRAGVPAGTRAAALNIAAVAPSAGGFLTVYPCDVPRPNAATLNYTSAQTIANATISLLSATGTVCIYSSQSTDLVVDVTGIIAMQSQYQPVTPARLLETRVGDGLTTIDGISQGEGTRPAQYVTTLVVGRRGGVPEDASAVVLNVAAAGASGNGYATVYPCDRTQPVAASLNMSVGRAVSNMVVAAVSSSGSVCLFNSQATELIVDVVGFVPRNAPFSAISPARLFESRSGQLPTIDGADSGVGRRGAGQVTVVKVAGRAGVPASADAVSLNVTIVGAPAAGYATVYPCGERPNAASIAYTGPNATPNAVVSGVDASGNVCVYTHTSADLVVDVNGYQTAP
jgi:alpha-tubulin suppressor-like RCC1 family protein